MALWPQLPFAPTHLRFSPDGLLLYAGGRKVGGATGKRGRGQRVGGAYPRERLFKGGVA